MFLRVELGRHLSHLVLTKAEYPYRVFKLIVRADAEGWADSLIAAASASRPLNAELRALAAEPGQEPEPEPEPEPAGNTAASLPALERVIVESSGFQDLAAWHARLGELQRQVCRIEVTVSGGTVMGTGFLVAPDLVLTNFHVVEIMQDAAVGPAAARLRFDHDKEGGTEFRLCEDWLVEQRPPSAADDSRNPAALPAAGELDFALLRLREPAPDRGWIRLGQGGVDGLGLERGHALIILQHPQDAPLKLAIGDSLGLNANKTRLRHRVNTRRGSSGSPCLNARLEVVALHHAGDPNFDPGHRPEYNAAIPVAAILASLAGTPLAAELA
jgi:hypothetical protein